MWKLVQVPSSARNKRINSKELVLLFCAEEDSHPAAALRGFPLRGLGTSGACSVASPYLPRVVLHGRGLSPSSCAAWVSPPGTRNERRLFRRSHGDGSFDLTVTYDFGYSFVENTDVERCQNLVSLTTSGFLMQS